MVTTKELIEAVEDRRLKRYDIVPLYTEAIKQDYTNLGPVNFSEVNHAIMNRWSASALEYIKKMAWDSLKPE